MSKLALTGGTPTRVAPYPKWPIVSERDIEAVTAVVRSGIWGGHPYPGPQSKEFIRRFTDLQGGGFPVYGRPIEMGQIYTSTAGLLNLLCIVNAVYMAYIRKTQDVEQ